MIWNEFSRFEAKPKTAARGHMSTGLPSPALNDTWIGALVQPLGTIRHTYLCSTMLAGYMPRLCESSVSAVPFADYVSRGRGQAGKVPG
jgi:hypothetical protein